VVVNQPFAQLFLLSTLISRALWSQNY